MTKLELETLPDRELASGIAQAAKSPKRRFPHILHSPGAEFNRVFNFMMRDSYMQPHLHPSDEKIEDIHLIEGRIAALFFDDTGAIKQCTMLEKGGTELISVPAFTWHTYVMLTDHAITYETMMGIYHPDTWKRLASWAPQEGSSEALPYLESLRSAATHPKG